MGKILAVPLGLIAYVISLVLILGFLSWFIDKPQDWDYFIPITTSLLALGIGVGVAESNGDSSAGKFVASFVAFFWVAFVAIGNH